MTVLQYPHPAHPFWKAFVRKSSGVCGERLGITRQGALASCAPMKHCSDGYLKLSCYKTKWNRLDV